MQEVQFFRRKAAGKYLNAKYGFGSERSLAKLASVGGGPEYRKAGTAVLYEPDKLDEWATSKIGKPQRSTSDTTGTVLLYERDKLGRSATSQFGQPRLPTSDTGGA